MQGAMSRETKEKVVTALPTKISSALPRQGQDEGPGQHPSAERPQQPRVAMRGDGTATLSALERRIWGLQAACVDCGRLTGGWCSERCYAELRTPGEEKYRNQRTPYCTVCDKASPDKCHYCREQHWCTPPQWPGRAHPAQEGTGNVRSTTE